MIMKPEFLRELDPRVSYLPSSTPRGPEGEETGAALSRLSIHPPPHSSRTPFAMLNSNPSNLASLSIEDLRRELERRERSVVQLQAKRERIVQELAAIDAEIAALGGPSGRHPGAYGGAAGAGSSGSSGSDDPSRPRSPVRVVTPRPKNTLSLTDALTAAFEPGTIVTPAEAAAIVRKDGYLTNSRTFNQTVTVALSKHPRFKRVGRGQYECLATPQESKSGDE
jgi:hypothetical protein